MSSTDVFIYGLSFLLLITCGIVGRHIKIKARKGHDYEQTKKSLAINAEILDAVEVIAVIEKRTANEVAEKLLQEYIMNNMSLLVGELHRLGGEKPGSVSGNA